MVYFLEDEINKVTVDLKVQLCSPEAISHSPLWDIPYSRGMSLFLFTLNQACLYPDFFCLPIYLTTIKDPSSLFLIECNSLDGREIYPDNRNI
jgi:hypothetical protein